MLIELASFTAIGNNEDIAKPSPPHTQNSVSLKQQYAFREMYLQISLLHTHLEVMSNSHLRNLRLESQCESLWGQSDEGCCEVGPNPSLKRSANGRPPGPVWRYAVHFRQPGPGVLPSSPA